MRQKILVVEDDPKISNIVRIYLTESGFDPAVADTATAARESLANNKVTIQYIFQIDCHSRGFNRESRF